MQLSASDRIQESACPMTSHWASERAIPMGLPLPVLATFTTGKGVPVVAVDSSVAGETNSSLEREEGE